MLSIRCISHSQRTAASCALLRTGDAAFVLFHYHYHKNAILMILVLTASGSDFTSSSIIRRFDRNNSPLLLFGQCKNRRLQKRLLHRNCFWLEQPHRGSGICRVRGGISVPHLDPSLSALPVFPQTLTPGHGPSWSNHQYQEQCGLFLILFSFFGRRGHLLARREGSAVGKKRGRGLFL